MFWMYFQHKRTTANTFLSPFLQNFFLCYDSWHGDVPPHLAQPCNVALGRTLIWGLYPDEVEGSIPMPVLAVNTFLAVNMLHGLQPCIYKNNYAVYIVCHPLPGFKVWTIHSEWLWANALDPSALMPTSRHLYYVLHFALLPLKTNKQTYLVPWFCNRVQTSLNRLVVWILIKSLIIPVGLSVKAWVRHSCSRVVLKVFRVNISNHSWNFQN